MSLIERRMPNDRERGSLENVNTFFDWTKHSEENDLYMNHELLRLLTRKENEKTKC